MLTRLTWGTHFTINQMYFKNLEAFINDTAISVTAQKMFSIKDFFSKCDQIRSFLWILSHLVTFAEEILNGKFHFSCAVSDFCIITNQIFYCHYCLKFEWFRVCYISIWIIFVALPYNQKIRTKTEIPQEQTELLTLNKSIFHHF